MAIAMKKNLTIKPGKVKFRKKWKRIPVEKVIRPKKEKLSLRNRRDTKIKLRKGVYE
jgi:hypothetical protein